MRYELYEIRRYMCDGCGRYVGDLEGCDYFTGSPLMGVPYVSDGDDRYCPNCALRLGLITALDFIDIIKDDSEYEWGDIKDATYKDGVVTYHEKVGKRYRKYEIKLRDEDGDRILEETKT